LARLTREIADAQQWFGLKAPTPVRSCYEAGRDGFWRHRYVTSLGIANVVVDSSSIEVNRRLRRAKSDALDVRKLLGMLRRYHAGERAVWSVVRVPTVEEEDRRQLHRELRTLKQERPRVANRMHGLLANQGLWLPPGTNIGAAAKTVRLWDGSPVPAARRARLEREWEHAPLLRTRTPEVERQRQCAMAGGWLRYQPRSRLSQWYQARFGRGGTRARKVGIVALARKLLIALWRFLEFGVVPEGASLKTA